MWGAAGEVRALRSLVKRVAASELEIAAAEADEAAAHWTAMVCVFVAVLHTVAWLLNIRCTNLETNTLDWSLNSQRRFHNAVQLHPGGACRSCVALAMKRCEPSSDTARRKCS